MQGYFTLNYYCNQKCITCPTSSNQKKLESIEFENLKKNILESYHKGMKQIVLSGGEPFAYKDIHNVISLLYDLDLGVTILTNGTLINDVIINLLTPLKERLTIVTAIHSSDENVHDYVTGVKGSFNKAFYNLKTLNKLGFNVHIKIILNKLNYLNINTLFNLIENNFCNKVLINICSMDYCGVAKNHFELYVNADEIDKALSSAVENLKINKKTNIRLYLSEYPICFMNSETIKYLMIRPMSPQFAFQAVNSQNVRYDTLYDCIPRGEKCAKCLCKTVCSGFWSSIESKIDTDLTPFISKR